MTDSTLIRIRDHIEAHCDEPLPLAGLARLAALSPSHLQKRFTAAFGLSPKSWQRACRESRLKAELRRTGDATGALYAAGYGSASRVYEDAAERLGMTPGAYAQGGAGLVISFAIVDTRLGRLLIAATDRGVCSVRFGEDDRALESDLRAEFPRAAISAMSATAKPELARWVHWLERSVDGLSPDGPEPAIDPRGTLFQQRVWQQLRRIPRGETRTYSQVAAAIGAPTAIRAVAGACAANRVAVLIPCHRVIRGDGNLAGFRWGLERKRALLACEQTC